MFMSNWTFEFFRKKLETMEHLLIDIKAKEINIMSQLDDLQAAISAEDVEIQDLVASITKIDTDIDALLAKIAAGGTMPDITAALTAIAAHTTALQTASAQLKADDAKANPPTA